MVRASRLFLLLCAWLALLAGCARQQLAGAVPAGGGGGSGCPPALSPPLSLDSRGDPLYPSLGNAGYDVEHYTLDLAVEPAQNTISGTATIRIQALQGLDAFYLDYQGPGVGSLSVDGAPAQHSQSGSKLRVELPQPVAAGQVFTATVAYAGAPQPVRSPAIDMPLGWQRSASGTYVSSEPSGAQGWYPVNDHPCDKATYTFRITVPKPYVACANGVLAETRDNGATVTYSWEMRQPMASYLAGVNVDDFIVHSEAGPAGLPIRSYYARAVAEGATQAFGQTADAIAYFNGRFGLYPFDAYGVAVVDLGMGNWAMENQTLSLFGRDVVSGGRAASFAPHELAHQWFGDSVSPKSWRDIWLNEGFATYGEALWNEHVNGSTALEAQMRALYPGQGSTAYYPPGNPPANDLFDLSVYNRGALTLHALRRRVGDDAFFRILQAYGVRYRYGNASTDDFVGVANEISGQELRPLFQAWLYDEAIPAYPEAASQWLFGPQLLPEPFRLPQALW